MTTRHLRNNLKTRIAKQRAFFASKAPGDLLVYVNRWRCPTLESFLCRKLFAGPVRSVLDAKAVPGLVEEYVRLLRDGLPAFFRTQDDAVPAVFVYWGIGGITAAMTALDPLHAENTSWLNPHLPWDRIQALRFDPENRWVQFALNVNRALWRCWDEDFLVLPFLHRSPLDAAYGVRGTQIFEEMYTQPDRVKALTDWCVDWQLALERFLAENAPRPPGWNGVWETWLPDRAVFVNGDPVGLISRSMALEFEQPFTARLFTSTGGGFFHNHTLGLYQVDQVARTAGLLVQEFVPDPKLPNLPEVLLTDPARRETILLASLAAPIMMEGIKPDQVDALLPILKEGRFILCVVCGDRDDPAAIIRNVLAHKNLR
jgi:hypothetical protein